MSVLPSLLLAALSAQSPAADSLRLLARRLPESALVLEAKARPLAVREAVAEAMIASVKAPTRSQDELALAGQLSTAYAAAWRDSFLIREVTRFRSWRPDRRAAKVRADSLRRAGVAAFTRAGPAAAITIWRRSLARASAIPDTTGVAAVLGNLGAGFLEQGRLDSAETYLERARVLAAAIGDFRVEGNAVGLLAEVSRDRGDLGGARERYGRAAALRERVGDTRGAAADQNNLGLLVQSLGDLEEARRRFEAALAINRREGRDSIAATNLVNLAGLASLAGEFARAEALYRDALATWRGRGMWAEAASALYGLGQLELRRGDYPAARAALREAVEIYDRTGPLDDGLAARRDLAGAMAAAGDLQGALDQLRSTQRAADSGRARPSVRAGIVLARADLAVQLNTFAEAERLYAQAERLFRLAGDAAGEADAVRGRALLLLDRDDHVRAHALLRAALRSQTAGGQRRAAALTRMSLGEAAWAGGDTAAARGHLARAALELDRVGDPVGAAAALGQRAMLEVETGRVAAAESLYRAGLVRLGDRVAPEVAWRLHAGLGVARRIRGGRGATDEVVRELRAAIAELERPSRSLALAERRSAFLSDKWEVYAELALTEHGRERIGAAFEASERLRAREMLELLARGRIPAAGDTAEDLVVREQDLRRRISELTRELEGPSRRIEALRGPDVSGAPRAVRDRLVKAQEAYSELLLEMSERAPRHAALLSRETASWRDVARRLGPDEAFIEYLVSDATALAFVVERDTVVALDLGVGQRDLARLVEFVRGTLEPTETVRGDSLWRGPLRRLHQHLVAPLEEAGLLAGKRRLIVVPHGELHYLPFAALLERNGRERFLVERYELTMVPSASVWLTLGDRSTRRTSAGTLAFAPRPDALPASSREVAAIDRILGAVRTFGGPAATEDVFRREASTKRVLHLATYGVLNKQNPLFSYVELAAGGSHDGRLEVHEVFGLRLAADLVVLSACQTGLASGMLADVPAGDDWVGLTRAFLHAGAARVMATLWPVEDLATAVLMERFYEGYGTSGDPVGALAAAQRAMLATPVTAHPFYWAGFVTVSGADVQRR